MSSSQATSGTALEEAQIALSIRLQCGAFTEACSEVGLSRAFILHVTELGIMLANIC